MECFGNDQFLISTPMDKLIKIKIFFGNLNKNIFRYSKN